MLFELEILICSVAEGNTSIRYYVNKDDIFYTVQEALLRIGHGGLNRTLKDVQKNI